VMATVFATTGAFANRYTISDIGDGKDVVGVNIKGAVVDRKGRIYRSGRWHRAPVDRLLAIDINDASDVLGRDQGEWFIYPWHRGAPIPLEGLTYDQTVWQFNNDRMAVGWYFPGGSEPAHCFFWTPQDHMVDLGIDDCVARAVNESGVIAGTFRQGHLFSYRDGEFSDLGGLHGLEPIPLAINRKGKIVGIDSETDHGFFWDGDSFTRLGLDHYLSRANDINDNGDIVGWTQDKYLGVTRAVRFTKTKVIELKHEVVNLGRWELRQAVSVNDKGVIVGQGYNGDTNQQSAFMLVPVEIP